MRQQQKRPNSQCDWSGERETRTRTKEKEKIKLELSSHWFKDGRARSAGAGAATTSAAASTSAAARVNCSAYTESDETMIRSLLMLLLPFLQRVDQRPPALGAQASSTIPQVRASEQPRETSRLPVHPYSFCSFFLSFFLPFFLLSFLSFPFFLSFFLSSVLFLPSSVSSGRQGLPAAGWHA
jgi:hypothetical protein